MLRVTIAKGLLIGALTLTVKAEDACGFDGDGTTVVNTCANSEQTCYVFQITGTPSTEANLGNIEYACALPGSDNGATNIGTYATETFGSTAGQVAAWSENQ